ncbi:helix-turn-helix domain-containing protein [Streptomyces sp. CA-253872]|uniref:helix-turn-helix domain-containing protein n=1 Tax=Streptomyces sp. CA-253872 TaxID=3240067 RepID=UPI003D8AE555
MNELKLDEQRSPRDAFGAKLRRYRKARGWTQERMAELTGLSGSHISAVETGRKSPTLQVARKLDTTFDLSEETFEEDFLKIRNGGSLLGGFPAYVREEGRAVEIRLFEVGLVPGILQTAEYARELAKADVRRGAVTPALAEQRLAYLAERQRAVRRHRPPMMLIVIDESCLRQWVGGDTVMRPQLDALLDFSSQPNAVLQVTPFTLGAARPFNLPVYLLTMGDGSQLSYAESQALGHVEREATRLQRLRTAFHHLQAEALSRSDTLAMIEQLRKGT